MATIHRSKTGAGPWLSTEDTGGGAATAGAARVLGPFPFAFDDVGLNDGIEFYTPTVGDVLLDAWIEVTEAFDGTTPKADIGRFTGGETDGYFSNYIVRNLSQADGDTFGLLVDQSPDGSGLSLTQDGANDTLGAFRVTPTQWLSADPVKVVASQDGSAGGTAVGGTAGAGAVYLVVATPSLT